MYDFGGNPSSWSDDELHWLIPYSRARVLGLGEAVHTSDGFYVAKVRLIQYLVENHGYRAITIESPWGKALTATHFVERGVGTLETALNGLFKVWRSKSIAGLLQWLQCWNESNPKDPVRFFGNDTQQADWDLNCLLSSSSMDQTQKQLLRELFEQMFGASIFCDRYGYSAEFQKLMTTGFSEHQDMTSEILNFLDSLSFEKNQFEYAARMSLSAFVLCEAKEIKGRASKRQDLCAQSFAHRDKCMSDLTLHFAGDDKTILWAHNEHIQRPSESLAAGFRYQGQYLKQALGDEYKALALTASKIEIHWPWVKDMKSPVLSEKSLERAVASRYPGKSVFLTGRGVDNPGAEEYGLLFTFERDQDLAARFDGLLVLPHSGPVGYAVDVTS